MRMKGGDIVFVLLRIVIVHVRMISKVVVISYIFSYSGSWV